MNKVKKKDAANNLIFIDYRIQFTVVLSHKDMCVILKGLAEHDIDINAIMMLYNGGNQSIYKLVIGKNEMQTKDEIEILRKIINLCEISYNEKTVSRLKLSNITANSLEDIYCTLCNHIDIKAMYLGVDNSLYIESDSTLQIKELLTAYYSIKKLV